MPQMQDAMTETLMPIRDATGLRIRCRCGAEATVPVGAARAPNACFNCSAVWPDQAVKEITRLIGWLNEDDSIRVDLVLVGADV